MSINLDNVTNIMLGNTPVEQIADSLGNVLWSSAPVVLPNYFYVEDTSGQANTLRIRKGGGGSAPTVEVFCSTDRVNWSSMGSTSTTPITATVPANGKLYLKANTERFGGGWDGENNINCSASFNVGGNIMSMLNGDNFEGSAFAPNTTHNFGCMFKWSNVVDASNLVLPDTVTSYCYWGCFYGCTSLTKAPALPATIMAEECYNAMFNGCGSLTTTPALPATTLANNCYFAMFSGCTSLATAPELPATTLATSCYGYMFQNCTSLTTAPVLPATTMANNCYQSMFDGCASLTTAPVLPATTLATGCYGFMFNGCASLTTAPALPATTLANGCYQSMFKSCTSLTTAPVLPATTMANNCYQAMFYGCSSLTTTPALPATTLANSCYEGMFWNCGSLTSAPATLPVTTLYAYCYANMFNSCGSLTTAPALPATTLANGCYRNMFNSCASLTTAPELPATTLTSYCYRWMFQGCSRLNRIVTYAQDISAEGCLDNWLSNVAATGDFYNNGEATYTSGASGIPTGWTEHKDTPDEYFWIENPSDYEIFVDIKTKGSAPAIDLYYSTDKVNWQQSSGLVDMEPQSKVYMKANTDKWATSATDYNHFDSSEDVFNVGGNIMSLLYGDNYKDVTTFGTNNTDAFTGLFYESKVVDASQLKLPTNTVTGCYNCMFYACESLTEAPALPATTLASSCYRQMFTGCTLLNKIVSYAEDASVAPLKTMKWLIAVSVTGDFYNLGNAGYTSGASGIPTGWTEHTSL